MPESIFLFPTRLKYFCVPLRHTRVAQPTQEVDGGVRASFQPDIMVDINNLISHDSMTESLCCLENKLSQSIQRVCKTLRQL